MAPLFENANVATDHNMLIMETMKRVADRYGQRPLDVVPVSGHVEAFTVSADGRWVAAGTDAGSVVRWDLAREAIQRRDSTVHRAKITCLSVDSASGAVLSTALDGTAVLSEPDKNPAVVQAWSDALDAPGALAASAAH